MKNSHYQDKNSALSSLKQVFVVTHFDFTQEPTFDVSLAYSSSEVGRMTEQGLNPINGEETMFLTTLPGIFTMTWLLWLPCLQGCSQKNHVAASDEKDIAAITAVSKARADAFNQGNAAGIAVHFTEDALLMAPDQPTLKGKAAVQSYYQHIFDDYETRLKSYYEEVKVSGQMAYGRGFAEVALIPKQGGQAVTSTAKYINIMKREADGTWKTTHDVWNGNEVTNKR